LFLAHDWLFHFASLFQLLQAGLARSFLLLPKGKKKEEKEKRREAKKKKKVTEIVGF
jgi:hypothetical protein